MTGEHTGLSPQGGLTRYAPRRTSIPPNAIVAAMQGGPFRAVYAAELSRGAKVALFPVGALEGSGGDVLRRSA
jgi:hypothetical protein